MTPVNYLRYDSDTKTTTLVGSRTDYRKGKPLELLEVWANIYGLGISGSHTAFQNRLAIRQKIPILIDPFRQIYFFPTIAPSSSACVWINASQIKGIKSSGLNAAIRFNDATMLIINIGRRSLMKQWKRCQQMEHLILHSHLEEPLLSAQMLP